MFGWIKRRLRRKHLKLVKQNVLAGEYLLEFQEDSISAGIATRDPFPSVAEINLDTSRGNLESLTKNSILPQLISDDALEVNRDLRRVYDGLLSGRRAFAERFGQASSRLLPFDQMFTPNEGWEIFFKHFGEATED